jgi:hypothetical protein
MGSIGLKELGLIQLHRPDALGYCFEAVGLPKTTKLIESRANAPVLLKIV